MANDVGVVDAKIDTLIQSVGRSLQVVDKVSVQIDTLVGNQRRPYSVIAVPQVDKIVLKRGEQEIETITAEELETKLDPQSRALIQAFEASMLDQFTIWTKVYPKRNSSPGPVVNAQIQLRLKEIGKQMCSDWKQIYQYLSQIIYKLADHYTQVGFLCNQLDSLI